MTRRLSRIILVAALAPAAHVATAQHLLQRVDQALSPAEEHFTTARANATDVAIKTLHLNPAFTHWRQLNDSASRGRNSIVYSGVAAGKGEGDFLPYAGNGNTDFRIGAYGEYAVRQSGTLTGNIQYAQGTHRNIGWSALRMPDLYLPYFSTDSCGGNYKYESYMAEGDYGFALGQWTLGVKASFYGEQAHRMTDPRALNNTTWLRFGAGAARQMGRHLLMADAGYGRNKQHMQLRYWRPGQQDRFFVCYGFGLYDNRQSAVSFGKSRMYYVDEFNGRLQYLSTGRRPLRLHASLAYAYSHMQTEESDIYNLYESATHNIEPMVRLTYATNDDWHFQLSAYGFVQSRKGYENIIEEYLIDKENNIYDFRTIDTQQNYSRKRHQLTTAIRAGRLMGHTDFSLQGGLTTEGHEEKYKNGNYSIKVHALTPHVKGSVEYQNKANLVAADLLYARRMVAQHEYNVNMQNQQIAHLDFQQAFAPYAWMACHQHQVAASVTWQHHFRRLSVGINGALYLALGHREDDVAYTQQVGFASTAPMISTLPDKNEERWGALTLFVNF